LTLPARARKVSDKKWFELLIASIDKPVVKGITFPGFPPADIQRTFVGSACRETLAEAFTFYSFLKNAAKTAGSPLQPESRFLDFGCGWGRFLRFFWKDINEENLHGCDIDAMIIDVCKSTRVPGEIAKIDPLGSLPYTDGCFDVGMAYSVFTHLPESLHLHWVQELARVTRPGGIFCLTLEPRRFLDFIADISEPDNAWYQMLSVHKPRLGEYYRLFDAGDLVFMPTNAGVEATYGDAVVPLSFVRANWSPWFEIIDYIDKPKKFWQAVLVVRRTAVPWMPQALASGAG
jgi:SAM-dependent methyltransferase